MFRAYINYCPDELTVEILKFLELRDLIQCGLVSRELRVASGEPLSKLPFILQLLKLPQPNKPVDMHSIIAGLFSGSRQVHVFTQTYLVSQPPRMNCLFNKLPRRYYSNVAVAMPDIANRHDVKGFFEVRLFVKNKQELLGLCKTGIIAHSEPVKDDQIVGFKLI